MAVTTRVRAETAAPSSPVENELWVDPSNGALRVLKNGRWRPVTRLIRTAAAAAYTVLAEDQLIGVTSTAAARTITLPAANSAAAGRIVIVKDESGACNTNNITIARAGSDTIDGATSVVMSTNYGTTRLYTDGATKWFTF